MGFMSVGSELHGVWRHTISGVGLFKKNNMYLLCQILILFFLSLFILRERESKKGRERESQAGSVLTVQIQGSNSQAMRSGPELKPTGPPRGFQIFILNEYRHCKKLHNCPPRRKYMMQLSPSLVHVFNNYSLNVYSVPGTVLDAWEHSRERTTCPQRLLPPEYHPSPVFHDSAMGKTLLNIFKFLPFLTFCEQQAAILAILTLDSVFTYSLSPAQFLSLHGTRRLFLQNKVPISHWILTSTHIPSLISCCSLCVPATLKYHVSKWPMLVPLGLGIWCELCRTSSFTLCTATLCSFSLEVKFT